jgi:osmotically-inducible protein OsmY
MNSTLIGNSTYRNTMLVAGLAFGLCIGTANAATEDSRLPQAHSDDFGATVTKTNRVMSDSGITIKVKSEMHADSFSKRVNVSIKTLHGVVMLKGSLPNQGATSM